MKAFGAPMSDADAKDFRDRLAAMTVRARLDHAEAVANGILGYPADPRRDDAEKILACVAQVRRALKRGDGLSVAGQMLQLERLCAAGNAKITGPIMSKAVASQRGASEGGRKAAKAKQEDAEDRNRSIAAAAEKLSREGNPKKAVLSILCEQFTLSEKQIARILKKSQDT